MCSNKSSECVTIIDNDDSGKCVMVVLWHKYFIDKNNIIEKEFIISDIEIVSVSQNTDDSNDITKLFSEELNKFVCESNGKCHLCYMCTCRWIGLFGVLVFFVLQSMMSYLKMIPSCSVPWSWISIVMWMMLPIDCVKRLLVIVLHLMTR